MNGDDADDHSYTRSVGADDDDIVTQPAGNCY